MTQTVPATELVWTFPGPGESAFVLHSDGQAAGRLQFAGAPGDRALAEWQGRGWTFEHAAGLRSPVTIRDGPSGAVAAVFTPWRNGGGIVEMASGARYCWNRKHVFGRTWCFRCQEQQSAVCVTQETGPLVSGGTVTLCPDAAKSPDLPVLVLLAWYLRVLDFESLSESMFVCG